MQQSKMIRINSQHNSFSIDFNNNKFIYIYYLLLHLICLSWTNTGLVQPPMIFRLVVTIGVFLPLVKYFWMAPAVFFLFVGYRYNSIAPFGYLPQSWSEYAYIILVVAVLHSAIYTNKKVLCFTRTQMGLFFFLFIVDLINLQPFSEMFYFSLMLFLLYNGIQERKSLNLAILAFVILTMSLSIMYFIFADELIMLYSERVTWKDPNYIGVLFGCGVILASAYVYRSINTKISIIYKTLFITCIILGFVSIIQLASRGAVLSVAIALTIQLLFSHTKFYIKLLLTIATCIGIVYLFQSGYFNILITRVQSDDGTGSGRSIIWISKLSQWSENILNFFGNGYTSSFVKFMPYNYDCHNEYVSTLINYGFIGLTILLVSAFKLCKIKKNRIFIISTVFFILTVFISLSPFSCTAGWTACPFLIIILYKFITLDKVEQYRTIK